MVPRRRPRPGDFAFVDGLLTSWIGGLVLIVSLAALWYHFFNGIRHLVWDTGAGFDLDQLQKSGLAVIVARRGDDRDHPDRRAGLREAPMSFRTDRQRVHGLGTAAEGTGHWWGQRLTSVALVPLTLLFLFPFARTLGADWRRCAPPTASASRRSSPCSSC